MSDPPQGPLLLLAHLLAKMDSSERFLGKRTYYGLVLPAFLDL